MFMSFAMMAALKLGLRIHILRLFGGDIAPNQQERHE
jgi:hypothetical protein